MKKLLTLLFLVIFLAGNSFAQLINESFDGTTFPPTGWIKSSTSALTWQRSTNTVHPSGGGTHSGLGLAYSNSWSVSTGVASLFTPALDFTGAPAYTVTFWMYRDGGYLSYVEGIDVLVNTTATTGSAVNIGTVNRAINMDPVVPTVGWYKYTFNIPSTFNGTTNYVIFSATTDYGNDIHIDDVSVEPLAVPGAAGVVSPADGALGVDPAVTFSWSAPTTGGAPTGYKLFLGTNPAADNILNGFNVGDVLTYTPAPLNLNTTYYWKVVPLNPAGDATGVPIWSFQTILTCALTGLVTDGITGDPIPGVNITAGLFTATTGDDGTYYFELDPGTYTVVFTKLGYQDVTVNNVVAAYGPSVVVDAQMYENALAPAVITAVVNSTDTQCDITWTAPFGPYEMLYDDGTAENLTAWQQAGNMNAVKFTPAGYPAEVQGGRVFVGDGSFPVGGNLIGQTFKMVVMDDNGAGGMPGTAIDSVEVTANNFGWVEFSGLSATITSGNFYLTMVQGSPEPNCVPVGVDQTQPTHYKSYSRNVFAGGVWTVSPYQDLMIRAYISGPVGSGDNSVPAVTVIPSKVMGMISSHEPLALAGIEGKATLAAIAADESDAPANYKLYRIFLADPGGPIPAATPADLIASPTGTTYTESGTVWENLAPGWYAYAVAAKYPNGDISSLTYTTQNVPHKQKASVTVNVSLCTSASPAGTTVNMIANDYPNVDYTAVVPASGQVVFPTVWLGNYTLTVHLAGFTDVVIAANVNTNKIYTVVLEEIKLKPRNLFVDDMTLIATWDAPLAPFIDENFEGGTFPPEGWQAHSSGDGWIGTANGSSTFFSIPDHTTYAVVNDDGAGSSNNGCCDYLVMPPVDLTAIPNAMLSFESYFTGAYSQAATVEMSTDAGATWTVVSTLAPNAPGAWVPLEVDLSAYSGVGGLSQVWLAFHANDNGVWASGWAVDDVRIGEPFAINVQGYGIFLDGTLVYQPIAETTYTFDPTTINYGQCYVAGVAGIYCSGFSELDTYNFCSHFLYPPRNLTATDFESAALLQWEAPIVGGDHPQGGITYQQYMSQNKLQEINTGNSAESGLAPSVNPAVLPGVTLTPGFNRYPNSTAWGNDAQAGTMVTFALDTPGTFTTLGPQPSDFIAGADIVDGVYYGCIYGGTWVTMDTTTGVFTTIGPTTDMSGLAYDFTTSTMYGVSYSGTLYTVNLETGATTSVGPTQSTLIALACDNDGVLYGVNIGGDNIGTIDKATGAWTLLAPIGFDASYAQDMTCDHSTNTLYWAAYNNSLGAGQLYIFDQTTFALTLVGNFASNHEVAGFAIAAQGSGGGGTEPVGLVSYNLYRDNAIVANIPKTELQYFDLNLFPDQYCYDITAVYDLTFYGGTGTAQSVKEGTACVDINYGYPVPFMEDWTTGAFTTNTWTTGNNWRMAGQMGNPLPAAEFGWDPPQVDYSLGLESAFINSAAMDTSSSIYKIYLDFDLALADRDANSTEMMTVEVWNGSAWSSVAEFMNAGDLAFTTQHIDITGKAKNRVFKVRFLANGAASTNIYYWLVDNIHIYYEFAPALNLMSVNTGGFDAQTVHLTWEAPQGGGSSTGESFTEDFEGGSLPAGWLAIDNDGDGFNWINTIEQGYGFDAHSGTGAMTSASYDNTAGPLTPDNWLITPPLPISDLSQLTYWHDAQDPLYAAEHYFIKVSTTDAALASFTTTIFDGITPATWEENTIDLSAFSGQTIYIAFQHVDVTDMFWMKLDDITVTELAGDKSKDAPGALTGFNVFRKGSVGDYAKIATTVAPVYDDNFLTPDNNDCYSYYVTVVYNEGESGPSNVRTECINVDVATVTAAKVNMYPNPATSSVTVDLTNDVRNLTVYNYLGSVVYERNINKEKSLLLNTSDYAAGAYTVRFTTTNGETFSKKLVIIK